MSMSGMGLVHQKQPRVQDEKPGPPNYPLSKSGTTISRPVLHRWKADDAAMTPKYLVHSTANDASEGCKGDTYAREARISLLELILNATHSDVSTTTEAVTLVGDFTRTIELMHAMGNPRLSFNSLQPEPALSAPVEGRTRLIRLLELFAHIQSFAPNHFGPESLSHWLLDSPYRRLETKLDEYTLQQPEVFSLSQESLQKSIGSGSIDQIHCTLMWHICVLVLNRGFLSIRGKSDGVASNPILIPYPAAPVHFLKEEERL
ncbi:hypothetical protein H2202_010876 [Exophiala xenobiotica]|nr:hypothetical protein H2202_010876 [Exophiala xenobiotica]